MLSVRLRGLLVVAALLGSTLPTQPILAQSADPDSAAVTESDAVNAAPVDNDETAPTDVPPPSASRTTPDYTLNARYLRQVQAVRTGWYGLENGFEGLARDLRLGAINPLRAQLTAGRYPAAVDRLERMLAAAVPPTQFAHVHQLHVAAKDEFHAAMDAAEAWLISGDPQSYRDGEIHFALFDQLIAQAVRELG